MKYIIEKNIEKMKLMRHEINMVGLDVTFEGYGYVKSYSIPKGTKINKGDLLEVVLESKYWKK